MNKGRLEDLGDGVLTVIITVIVLAMKSPRGTTAVALCSSTFAVQLHHLLTGVLYWPLT